jgi:hypothetical protein
MMKSKTTTITIDGDTLPVALIETSEFLLKEQPKIVLQVTAYPVDDYWVVQVTYK